MSQGTSAITMRLLNYWYYFKQTPYSDSCIHIHLAMLAPESLGWECIRMVIGYYLFRPLHVLGKYFGLGFCTNISSCGYYLTLCYHLCLPRLTLFNRLYNGVNSEESRKLLKWQYFNGYFLCGILESKLNLTNKNLCIFLLYSGTFPP